MIVIHYSKTYQRLHSFIQGYNDSQPELKDKIRQNVMSTAKEIIRIYGKVLSKSHPTKGLDATNLPPLSTNNGQLAKLTNCSTRTIQRHIHRLMDAGIIQEKKWRGKHSNYLLWINTQVLFTNPQNTDKTHTNQLQLSFQKATDLQLLNDNKKTSCRPSETGNITGNITNRIIGVDKLEDPNISPKPNETSHDIKRSAPSDAQPLSTSYTTSYKTRNTGENVLKKSKGAGENGRLRARHTKEMNAPKDGLKRTASLSFYVQLLWLLAQKLLYKDVFLTEYQHEIAKELLSQWYENVPEKHLFTVHEIYVERVGLVRKYLNRHPQWTIQLPHLYFDPANRVGFAGTKSWYYQYIKRKKEVRNQRITHNQIQRFINNDTKSAAQRIPPITLYLECQKRVLELEDPALLKKFNTAIANPSKNQLLA